MLNMWLRNKNNTSSRFFRSYREIAPCDNMIANIVKYISWKYSGIDVLYILRNDIKNIQFDR